MSSVDEFLEKTTFHGLADIQATKSKPLKIFWATFVVLVFVFCGYQVASALYLHIKGEIVTEVEHFVTKVRPNLTICAKAHWSRGDDSLTAVEPITSVCTVWDEDDFFWRFTKGVQELMKLEPDNKNCTTKTDVEPRDPNCSIVLQQSGSSLAVNYVDNGVKRFPPYAEVKDPEWVSHENRVNRRLVGRKHLTRDFRDTPEVKCTSLGDGQPTNDSGIVKYYSVGVRTQTNYAFYVNGIEATSSSNGYNQGYRYRTFVTISKRYNLRNCNRKYTLQEQAFNNHQCMSNVLVEASGCCLCGFELACPSEKLSCCTGEQVCKAKLRANVLQMLRTCEKPIQEPCEKTTYSSVSTSEYLKKLEGRDPRVEIRFQNLFEVVLFRQRYRYDFSWLLSTIGGFLGLLIGGSVLSLIQAFIFCVRLCAKDFAERSKTSVSIKPSRSTKS